MKLLDHLRTSARANRLANHRLHRALSGLDAAAFTAARASFFGSLAATLDHILAVDGYYLDALARDPAMASNFETFAPSATLPELQARQATSDARLIGIVDALREPDLDAKVVLDRGITRQHEAAGRILAHLFMHQTHHRGQVHGMLSATEVAPPQLDEFLMRSDAPNRVGDLRELGWTEGDLFAPAA